MRSVSLIHAQCVPDPCAMCPGQQKMLQTLPFQSRMCGNMRLNESL